jgi:hypothetical protein
LRPLRHRHRLRDWGCAVFSADRSRSHLASAARRSTPSHSLEGNAPRRRQDDQGALEAPSRRQ